MAWEPELKWTEKIHTDQTPSPHEVDYFGFCLWFFVMVISLYCCGRSKEQNPVISKNFSPYEQVGGHQEQHDDTHVSTSTEKEKPKLDTTNHIESENSKEQDDGLSEEERQSEIDRRDAEEERGVFERYRTELDDLKKDSAFFDEHQRSPHPIPRFRFEAFELGDILGVGGFSTVKEIRGITLNKDDDGRREEEKEGKEEKEDTREVPTDNDEKNDEAEAEADNVNGDGNDDASDGLDPQFSVASTERYMAQNVLRESQARYAIKQLRTDLIRDEDIFDSRGNRRRSRRFVHWRAMLDLAIEAQFMAVLSHPNICKMRGVAGCPVLQPTCPLNYTTDDDGSISNNTPGGFFIVLDRLFGTLREVIAQEWTTEEGQVDEEMNVGFFSMIFKDKENIRVREQMRNDMYLKRLKVAYDVASAMRFLHSKRLLYRDLKSANIGFDVRGDIKLFDFGLCRELPKIPLSPSSSSVGTTEPVYKLTGRTGSRPYMAPEIDAGKPYNQKADVFSFGVLLYEIFALRLPLFSKHRARPVLGEKWPTVTKALLEECWDTSIEARPDFNRITSVLKGEMADIADALNMRRDPSIMDRSRHLLDRSAASRRLSTVSIDTDDMDLSQRSSHLAIDMDEITC